MSEVNHDPYLVESRLVAIFDAIFSSMIKVDNKETVTVVFLGLKGEQVIARLGLYCCLI